MNQLYKTTSFPPISSAEAEPSNILSHSSNDPLPPSTFELIPSLCQLSPLSFSPHLHCILGRSRYVPTEDEDPKGGIVADDCRNFQSDTIVNPPEVSETIEKDEVIPSRARDDTQNSEPGSLEYSDGEGGKVEEIVVSESNEEEVDELNSSEYGGLLMVGMLVNTDLGGYYEKITDDMDMVDDTAPMDMDGDMLEAMMDDRLPVEETELPQGNVAMDEIPVKMNVNGETCLFSQAAIAELHLLRENVHLREVMSVKGHFYFCLADTKPPPKV
jgi:hypothetical protein